MAEDMALISLANYDDAISAAKEKSGNPAPMTSAELAPRIRSIRTAPADPHTLLLIHGDKIEDASMYGVPLTNNGVVVSSNQSKFGGKSLYFNGDSWVNFPEKYAAYRDKDFTIDWWEYCMTSDVNHQSRYFSTDAGGPYSTLGLLLGHLGKQAYCGNGWSMINGAEMFNIVQRQWVHWATVRSGNTLYTFRNGVKFAQTPIVGSIPYDEKTSHCIGGWRYSPGQKWIGYMSEFRISNVARWTSDFVPADKPYDNIDRTIIEPLEVAENGVYTAEHGRAYNPVSVKCPAPKLEQEKTATPSKATQQILPDTGKALSKVTVNPIPAKYQDTSDATASAGEVFAGKTAYLAGGKATGTFTIEAELAAQDTKIAALQQAVKEKAGGSGGGGGGCGNWSKVEVESWTPAENTQKYKLSEDVAGMLDCIIITHPYPGTAKEVMSLLVSDFNKLSGFIACEEGAYYYAGTCEYLGGFIDLRGDGYANFIGGHTYTVTKCYK